MKIIEAKDYDELSSIASEMIINKVTNSQKLNLGLATGSTPLGLYRNLVENHRRYGTTYVHVKTFNLDEYVGLNPRDMNSYHSFMKENLFNYIDLKAENTFIPNGFVKDLDDECEQYESLIEKNGGIDLQILGLGCNGHIGFNEPGSSFQSKTHIVELNLSTRKANSRFFNSIDEVPPKAITMGIATIMKSKEILLLVSGKGKLQAFQRLLEREDSSGEFPASILKEHPNLKVIVDSKIK